LWDRSNGQTVKKNIYGEGRIFWGKTPREVLLADRVLPDFVYKSFRSDSEIDFIHRSLENTSGIIDIYFVANFKDRWEELECTFRIKNKVPEVWNPETGVFRDIVVYNEKNGRITCPLSLPPHGSLFVVFRNKQLNKYITSITRNSENLFPTENAFGDLNLEISRIKENIFQMISSLPGHYTLELSDGNTSEIKMLENPDSYTFKNTWIVNFPSGWGAPDSITITNLKSWTEYPEPGIKYFSGTAVYTTTFNLPDTLLYMNRDYSLDIGQVKDIAEITVNNQPISVLWKPPYRADITPYIKSGVNRLKIKVTNLWPNRLIGDQFLPIEERVAFTNIGKFTKKSTLLESGLLGPVKIVISRKSTVAF